MGRLRLGYTKSRTGCRRCKQRRVKVHTPPPQCDEKRPCTACIRHHVPCSLVTAAAASASSSNQSYSPQSTETSKSSRSEAHTRTNLRQDGPNGIGTPSPSLAAGSSASIPPLPIPGPTSNYYPPIFASSPILPPIVHPIPSNTPPFPSTQPTSSPKSISVADLELLHHYTTTTCYTLPHASEVSHIWKVELVKLSFSNEPVLHQILALSGFHLALLRPEQRQHYSLLATKHQSDAAQGLRAGLTTITPDNCHALFAGASLLIIGAFASRATHCHHQLPRQNDVVTPADHPVPTGGKGPDEGPSIQDFIDIIVLTRGISVILSYSESIIKRGRFADLFKLSTYTAPMLFLEVVCEKLEYLKVELKQQVSSSQPNPPAPSQLDESSYHLIIFSISKLIHEIKRSIKTSPIPELRVTMTWPIELDEGFLHLVRQKNPGALILVLYHCALIRQSEPKAWYIQGWSSSVARDLRSMLDPEWRRAIAWPLGTMGMDVEDGAADRREGGGLCGLGLGV